jgi:hypothetical protein
MTERCKLNPCCSDPYDCKPPDQLDGSRWDTINKRWIMPKSIQIKDVEEKVRDSVLQNYQPENIERATRNKLTAEDFATPWCSTLTRREMDEQLKRYNRSTYDGVKAKQVLNERTAETNPFPNMLIPADVVEILEQCCKGPVWDGNLVSKSARDVAYKHQWLERAHGWNFLSYEGVMLCHHVGILKA